MAFVIISIRTMGIFSWLSREIEWAYNKGTTGTRWFLRESHWGGLIPTLILGFFAYFAFIQTREQLTILQEELAYVRKPVIILRTVPDETDLTNLPLEERLFVANIGNDTAENVNMRFGLFMVNENNVYSLGEIDNFRMFFTDTTRPPRAKIFSRLSIAPNREVEFTERLNIVLHGSWAWQARDIDSIEDIHRELSRIQSQLKGQFILFSECSYRRKSDYVLEVDTTYFVFRPFFGIEDSLRSTIGGMKTINRLRRYLENGPRMSIFVWSDKYVIDKHIFGPYGVQPTIVQTFRREKEKRTN